MSEALKMRLLEIENFNLRAENKKIKADLDYVCMMTDVDIPEEEKDEQEVSEG